MDTSTRDTITAMARMLEDGDMVRLDAFAKRSGPARLIKVWVVTDAYRDTKKGLSHVEARLLVGCRSGRETFLVASYQWVPTEDESKAMDHHRRVVALYGARMLENRKVCEEVGRALHFLRKRVRRAVGQEASRTEGGS